MTFSDLHGFKDWSLLDEPVLLIGMCLLSTMQQFLAAHGRRKFRFMTWPADRPRG